MALPGVDENALDAFLASDGEEVVTPDASTEPVTEAEVEHEIPEPDPAQEVFDRKYVEKLRKESAGYRDRAKKYNDVFDGYEPEAVDEWMNLATTLKSDPKAAAARFAELADAIRAEYGDAAGDDAEATLGISDKDPELSDNQPLTRAEFDRLMSERERTADLDRRVRKIESDAVSLGYEKGSDEYDYLLWKAGRLPSGSVQDAHAAIQAQEQAIFDRRVKAIGDEPNPRVPVGGAAVGHEKPLDTFEEANAALDAWLQAQG